MTIWFSSDQHYGHKNIIKYSNRPYKDVEEMNHTLIVNHNSVVRPEDTVYYLGDFGFMHENDLDRILSRLNGEKFLIWGNHDKIIKNSQKLQRHFKWIKDYYEVKTQYDNKDQKIILCHYPMISWNQMHRGSWMVHGHTHGNLRYPFKGRILDAGVDPCNYYPINVNQIGAKMNKIIPEFLDHHVES